MVKEKLDAVMARHYMSSQNEIFKLSPEELRHLGKSEENALGRRQGIEISKGLRKKEEREVNKENESWAEELRAADERCEKYRRQISDLEKAMAELTKNAATFSKQVESRDIEIKRLQALYEGGQTLGKLKARYVEESSEEMVVTLTAQLELLGEENRRLESELQKYKGSHRAALEKLEAQHKTKASQLLEKNKSLLVKIKELKETIAKLKKENAELVEQLNNIMQDSKGKQQQSLELSEQVKRLEVQIANSQKDIDSYAHFKSAEQKSFSDTVNGLQMERDSLLGQNRELAAELQELRLKLRSEGSSFKGQLADASREIERSQVNAGRAMNEIKLQTEESIALRKQIHDMDGELLAVRNERNNLRLELEMQQRKNEVLEAQLGAHRDDFPKNKAESGSRFEALYNSAKTEIEYLKKSNEQLDQLLGQQNARVAELSGQAKEQRAKASAAEERLKELQQEYQGVREQLVVRNTEVKRLEIRGAARDDSQAQRMEAAESLLRGRAEQLEIELGATKNLLNKSNEKARQLVGENIQLRTQIQSLEQENLISRTKADRAKIAEQDLAIHKATIEILHKKDMDAARQMEEVQMRLQRSELESEGNKKRAEIALEQLKDLEEELRKRGEEVLTLKLKLGEYEKDTLIQEAKKKELSTHTQGMKDLLLAEQEEKGRLENELKEVDNQLKESKGREEILNKQVIKLKALIDNIDNANNELMEQMSKSIQSKKNEELILMQQVERLKGELASRENELASAKLSIEQLDSSLNQLQTDLDIKAEECRQCKLRIEELNSQLKKAARDSNLDKQILRSESEIRELRERLMEVSKELEDAREQLAYKDREAQELNNDLHIIAKQNQYVNAELSKLSKSQNNLKQIITEELQFKQQSLKPVEYGGEEVIPQMEHISEIVDENKALHAKVQELNAEIGSQEARIEELAQNEQNYVVQINKLNIQIDELIQQLNIYKESQQVSSGPSLSDEEINKLIMGLQNAEKQIEILRRQVDEERERYGELEQEVENEREQKRQADLQLKDLVNERSNFKSEIMRLTGKISGSFRRICRYRGYDEGRNNSC